MGFGAIAGVGELPEMKLRSRIPWAVLGPLAALALLAGPDPVGLVPGVVPARAQETSADPGARAGRPAGERDRDFDNRTPAWTPGGKPLAARAESQESLISWLVNSSGAVHLVTVIIAAMSFYLFALIIWMALRSGPRSPSPGPRPRPPGPVGAGEVPRGLSPAGGGRVASGPGAGARVRASRRAVPAQRAMELANEDATMEMEHRTTYLATVGTLGPDDRPGGDGLGHDQGVPGDRVEGSTAQAYQLAAGISTALIATLEGIALSIPAIYFYSMFRNRIARLSLELGMRADPLLDQFSPGVRNREPGAGPVPATPPGCPRRCPCPAAGPRPIPIRMPPAPRSRREPPPQDLPDGAVKTGPRPGLFPARRLKVVMPRAERRLHAGLANPNLTPLWTWCSSSSRSS